MTQEQNRQMPVLSDLLNLVRMKATRRFHGEDYPNGEYQLGADATAHLREILDLIDRVAPMAIEASARLGESAANLENLKNSSSNLAKAYEFIFADRNALKEENNDLRRALRIEKSRAEKAEVELANIISDRKENQTVPYSLLKKCEKQRDELLEALKYLVGECEEEMDDDYNPHAAPVALARAAIANASEK